METNHIALCSCCLPDVESAQEGGAAKEEREIEIDEEINKEIKKKKKIDSEGVRPGNLEQGYKEREKDM